MTSAASSKILKLALFLASLLFLPSCLGVRSPVRRGPAILLATQPVVTRVVTLVADQPVSTPSQRSAQPTSTAIPEVSAADPTLESLLAQPALPVTVTSQEQVNLRGGPGAFYGIVARVPAGSKLSAVGVSTHGEWLALRHPDDPRRIAWVYRLYTDYDPENQALPVIELIPATPAAIP